MRYNNRVGNIYIQALEQKNASIVLESEQETVL